MPEPAPDVDSLKLLFRMLKFLKPVWKIAVVAALVIVARSLMEVLAVYFLSPAVTAIANKLTEGRDEGGFWLWVTGDSVSARELRSVLLWMALSQVGLGITIYLRSVWDTKLSMHAVYHIRAAVYDRLQRAHFTYHDRMSSGKLINRAINDLQAVRQFVNMSLLSTLDILTTLGFYFGLLWFRSPGLMFAALVPIPLWSVVIVWFSRRAQPLCRKQQVANDRLMSVLSENLAGIHVVKAFATEQQEITNYGRINGRLLAKLLKTVQLQAIFTPSLKLIAASAHILLFVFTAWNVRNGRLNIGDIMILGAAMGAILMKLQQINAIVEAYQKAIVSSRRLIEILDLPDALAEQKLRVSSEYRFITGEIEFQDVSFSYGSAQVLERINAKIPGGKVTAIVGPTGSGKTTLAGLIGRFYDPDRGAIFIDGQDVRSMNLRQLRRLVGYVFQETFLFSSTIRDNIRYGRSDVSDEMVRHAARIAMADEFIEKLPQGYDTLIGEQGVALSGGQRQRLALARALVYDPAILILDDATAALDATTEELVHQRLDSVFKGRTVLLIANRLTSVKDADYVLVLENGRLTQKGTHEELLRSEGHYRDIVRIQENLNEMTSDLISGSA